MKRFYFKVAAAVAVVAFAASSYVVVDEPVSTSDTLVLQPATASAPLVEAPVIEAPGPVEPAVETQVVATEPATTAAAPSTPVAETGKPAETKSVPAEPARPVAKSVPVEPATTVAAEEVAPEIGTACTLSRDSADGPVTSEGC